MKKIIISTALVLVCSVCFADVTVKVTSPVRDIKLMNSLDSGGSMLNRGQVKNNVSVIKVDVLSIFKDFTKDVNDPASYDFRLIDQSLRMNQGGTVCLRIFQKIKHTYKKPGNLPPADLNKWAGVVEHIISHFNDGWANGFEKGFNIVELWNEPDLDYAGDAWKADPHIWKGKEQEYYGFFKMMVDRLKSKFPGMIVGGPALAWLDDSPEKFLEYMRDNNVPLDFFSWHCYGDSPEEIAVKAHEMRTVLDKYGFTGTQSVLDEWNYIINFGDDFVPSIKVINSIKGAAFVASVMQVCQNAPVDILMRYGSRGALSGMSNSNNSRSFGQSYYALYAWSKLLACGTQVEAHSDDKDIYVTAATNANGRTAILVTRFNEDNSVVLNKSVKIHVPGLEDKEVTAHFTDSGRLYTEAPIDFRNGSLNVNMEPNSFVMIEIR